MAKVEAAEADYQASIKTKEEAEKRYKSMQRQRDIAPRSVSDEDFRGAKLTWDRYTVEEAVQAGLARQAGRELRAALAALQTHEVRSHVAGVIRAVSKHRGEAVQDLETVVELDVAEK